MPFRSASDQKSHAALAAMVAVGLCGLTACAPDLGAPSKVRPISDYAAEKVFAKAAVSDWPADDWWTAFNDPTLNSLIERALKSSPDLRAVQARLTEAAAAREAARASLFPTLNAKGSIQETGVTINFPGTPQSLKNFLPSDIQPFTQLSGNLSYQLDFFGRNHAAVAAASSQAKAAQFEVEAARLQLSAAVATAYANLIMADADQAAAEDAAKLREGSRTLVGDRERNGLETRAEFRESDAERESSEVDLVAAKGAALEARYALAALVGEGPDTFLDLHPGHVVEGPIGLPPHLAADLIGRRPDVAAARLRVEAAAQNEKVARANFYPNIDLTASDLVVATRPQDIFTHNLNLVQFGPALSLPIFDGGKLAGALRNSRGEYEEAVANYDKAVVQALHEVSDAITIRRGAQESIDHAKQALDASQDAYNLAVMRYKAGLSTYLSVLTAENTLVATRRQYDDLQARAVGAEVELIRALGGGFNETAPAKTQTP
ncbi:MAG TPA: efflux transporter outer membrane subunit [Caulobacteraceae bacterium]|nr:efflux transporter outer membrane subunit [Caulobacteraceae bacterium]